MKRQRRRTWALSSVGPASLVAVATVTIAAFTVSRLLGFGGAWGDLNPLGKAADQNEMRDWLFLSIWLVTIVVMALTYLWLTRQRSVTKNPVVQESPSARQERFLVWLGAASILILFSLALWNYDPLDIWKGTGWLGLLVGTVVASIIWLSWFGRDDVQSIARLALIGVGVLLVVNLAARLPGVFEDYGDFAFTSEDLLAVSVGRIPLHDFIPQYSVLFGYVVAPFVRMLGHPLLIAFAVLTVTQLLMVGLATIMAWRIGGRRFIAPAIPVFLGMSLAIWGQNNQSATSYFATFPIRTFLPALTIVVALFLYSVRNRLDPVVRAVIIGFLAGVTVLNNLDFGLAAFLALAVTVSLVEGMRSWGLVRIVAFFVGSFVPFGMYWAMGWLLSKPIDFTNDLIFIEVFTRWKGFLQPIEPFGLHVGIVALFATAAVTGLALTIHARHLPHSFRFRQGLAMLMTGGWGVLGLPYFVGRSLTATLLAASAVPVGLTLVACLPWIYMAFRSLRQVAMTSRRLGYRAVPATVAFLVLAIVAAPLSTTVFFWDRIGDTYLKTPFELNTQHAADIMALPENQDLQARLMSGQTVQLLPQASATEIMVGWKSGLQTNSPENLRVDPVFASMQCAELHKGTAQSVVILGVYVDSLKTSSCRRMLDLEHPRVLSNEGPGLVELELLR